MSRSLRELLQDPESEIYPSIPKVVSGPFPQPGDLIYTDDFERSSISPWVSGHSGSEIPTVQIATDYYWSGTRSLQVAITVSGGGGDGWADYIINKTCTFFELDLFVYIVSQGYGNGNAHIGFYDSNNLELFLEDVIGYYAKIHYGGSVPWQGSAYSGQQWHHIQIMYDGTAQSFKYYLDGNFQGQALSVPLAGTIKGIRLDAGSSSGYASDIRFDLLKVYART
jgi:hypothetical protein